MGNRWFHIAVGVCWLISMSWLVVVKVLPPLIGGDPPDYRAVLPQKAGETSVATWDIYWNDSDIGWATHEAKRSESGKTRVESIVHFEQLPIDRIATEFSGSMMLLFQRLLSGRLNQRVDMEVASEIEFDAKGRMQQFRSKVHLGSLRDFIWLDGVIDDGALELTASTPSQFYGTDDAKREIYRRRVELPENALATDAFSPHPRLPNLRLGQTWTFCTYRPLSPHAPNAIIEAKVERAEPFLWCGKTVPTFVVVYREDAGAAVSVSREPIGRLWVAEDGEVLKQELHYASLKFTFVRRPDDAPNPTSPQELDGVE